MGRPRVEHRFIDDVEYKRCSLCEQWLLLGAFSRSITVWDGLNGRCKACDRRLREEWRQGHPDYYLAANRRWREAHPERCRELDRLYRSRQNREARAATKKRWQQANSERRCAAEARRNARKRSAPGYDYTTATHIAARCEMWGRRCYLCGAPMEAVDHVIPLAKGGPHWPANLRPICKSCNSAKKDKWPYDLKPRARANVSRRMGNDDAG